MEMTMSSRPGGPGSKSTLERLVLRNLAGLAIVAVVVLLGGIIFAAVLRGQSIAIEKLSDRIDSLERQLAERPEPSATQAASDETRQAGKQPTRQPRLDEPSEQPQESAHRESRESPPVESSRERNQNAIVAALRNVLSPDTYGRLTLVDAEAGTMLLVRILESAQADELAPRVLVRGAILAVLLNNPSASQELITAAEEGDVSTAPFYEVLARQRLADGQTDAAIVAATRLAEQTNNGPTALVLLATAQRQRDEPAAVRATLSFSRNWAGLTPPDRLLLARAWAAVEDAGNVEVALNGLPADLDNVLDEERLLLNSVLQLFAGDAEAALPILQQIHARRPDDTEIAIWTGMALRETGQRDEARDVFQAVAQSAPQRAGGHYWLGMLAKNDGDFAAADQYLQQAVAVAPRYAPAWEAWGTLALNAGQLQPAFDRLGQAIDADPQRAQSHFIMAIALAKAEREEEAAEALRQAIKLDASLVEQARLTGVFSVIDEQELEAILDPTPAS
jgi:tetratricopeptide (TPR) repeat protein